MGFNLTKERSGVFRVSVNVKVSVDVRIIICVRVSVGMNYEHSSRPG